MLYDFRIKDLSLKISEDILHAVARIYSSLGNDICNCDVCIEMQLTKLSWVLYCE